MGGTGTVGDIEYRKNGNNRGYGVQEKREQRGLSIGGTETVGTWTKKP
jgi:hypothetical protein